MCPRNLFFINTDFPSTSQQHLLSEGNDPCHSQGQNQVLFYTFFLFEVVLYITIGKKRWLLFYSDFKI